MKNFKKIIFFSIITIASQKSLYSEHMGERAAKILGAGLTESTKLAINGGKEIAKTMADGGTAAAEKFGADAAGKLGEAAEKLGADAAKQFAPIAGAIVCVYSVTQLARMGTELYTYNYPDEEKKARINKARAKNQSFKAKQEFRVCLMSHAKSPRNASGRPAVCEDLARMFAMMASSYELDEMTEIFKSVYQE